MIIGYDGKRAFQNKTGLGNYSRSLISILAQNYPANEYILFSPRQSDLFQINQSGPVKVITPGNTFYKSFGGLWRRYGMVKNIVNSGTNIYHGLSNELPQGLGQTAIKKVVTIHDLIFERFPGTYNFDEQFTHRWKIKHACKIADAVIAISEQTKNDLVEFYDIPASKIYICYQSCNPIFEKMVSNEEKISIKKRYQLPDQYFLFVSSITQRKNLLAICKALNLLKGKLEIPLVVIGNGKKEKEAAREFMVEKGLGEKLILLNELPQSGEVSFTSADDFPAIYQQATALIYPSIFEGFGLPVLESLWSCTPVISSNRSSMPEVGGDAVLYFDPTDHKMLAQHMSRIASDPNLALSLRSRGLQQAKKFDTTTYAKNIMEIYKQLI